MTDEGDEGKKSSPEGSGEEKEKLRSRLESKMKGLLNRPGKGDKKDDGTGGESGAADGGAGAGNENVAKDQPKPDESEKEEKKPKESASPAPSDEPALPPVAEPPSEQADAEDMKEISESPANSPEKPPKDKKDEGRPPGSAEKEGQPEKGSEKSSKEKKEEKDEPEGDDKEDDSEKGKKKPAKKEDKNDGKKEDSGIGMPKESLEELQSQKEEIVALLSSVEDSYRDATLPEKTYREVKDKNESKLADVNKKIEKIKKSGGGTGEPEASSGKPSDTPSSDELEQIQERMSAEASVTGSGTESPYPNQMAAATPSSLPEGGSFGQKKEFKRAEALINILEEKIEERLKDVIASASVEVTDKRLRKMDTKVDGMELNVKSKLDVMATELKDMKTAAESVATYDKQFTTMKTEVEKVKALVDSVKEAKNIVDEKMQRTTENFAEIRSIVYQREASSKEQAVLMDKLKDNVSQIDTARILREFTTRDEQMRDVNTRLERIERSNKMTSDSLSKIKGLMTDIGSLENIMKASKHVGEKLERIQEIEERQKATTSRLDGVYVDMKKKLDEFNDYRVNQDKLNGMVEDIVKNVEDVSRRLSDYATKADITIVKDEVKIVREIAGKAASAPAVQASAPAAASNPQLAKLNEQKSEIETMLSTLEENFKTKAMSEEDYKSAKEKNMQKLVEIEKKMKAASSSAGGADKASAGSEGSHSRVMLIAKLRESYENGEISRTAYEKSRRLLLGKG